MNMTHSVLRRLDSITVYRRIGSATAVAVAVTLLGAAALMDGIPRGVMIAVGLLALVVGYPVGELVGALACRRGSSLLQREFAEAIRFAAEFGDSAMLRSLLAREPGSVRQMLDEVADDSPVDRVVTQARRARDAM
jgi:hypothetical protein